MSESALPSHFTRLTELDEARAIDNPGRRLEESRRGARRLKTRIGGSGTCVSVRTADLITFPYPTKYGLEGVARSFAPFVMMTNRMQLVQVRAGGELVNVLINPSEPERSLEAPFFKKQLERYGAFISKKVLSTRHGSVESALASWGVAPEDIDYITFDHLHVQDVRGLLGTERPEPGFSQPTRPLLPNARLLAQRDELRTLASLHPLQVRWYVRDAIKDVAADKLVALDGDYMIGPGLAIIRTPGHTDGNHSPVLYTDRGFWTISENGIAVDAYAPESSRISGLRGWARHAEVEVILNANTRERTLDQYTSMIVEKTIADPCPDRPEFPQHFSSSELTKSLIAPGLEPTYSHGHITHGDVVGSKASSASSSAA